MRDSIDPNDELLDPAIASLRDLPLPPGPTPIAQERTLRAIAAARHAHRRWNVLRIAAAILLLIGIASIALYVQQRHDRGLKPSELVAGPGTPILHPAPRVNSTTAPAHGRPALPPPETHEPILAANVSITGRVFYRGPRPARKPIDLSACPQCAAVAGGPIYDESLVVNEDGSLQNVVVSISGGLPPGEQFASATDPVTLDQRGCTFRPHVIAARVGQPIIVKNSDPFLHTVRSLDAEESPAFNIAQPTIGQRRVEPLRAVETFEVTCDLHPWMKAWVRVFNHPYFTVTRADGSFSLPPLPPGTYRVKAWHETLGVREKLVVVTADAGHPISITFEF